MKKRERGQRRITKRLSDRRLWLGCGAGYCGVMGKKQKKDRIGLFMAKYVKQHFII